MEQPNSVNRYFPARVWKPTELTFVTAEAHSWGLGITEFTLSSSSIAHAVYYENGAWQIQNQGSVKYPAGTVISLYYK